MLKLGQEIFKQKILKRKSSSAYSLTTSCISIIIYLKYAKKTSEKLYALNSTNLSNRKILMNAFFNSQFSYCPFIWMCHSHIINKKINRLHERCLRIIYFDKQSSFEELLEKDSSASIHEKNIQILATETYKVRKDMSPPQITKLFARRHEHPCNLRHNAEFLQPLANSVRRGIESISYLGHTQILIKIYTVYITSKRLLRNGRLKTAHEKFTRFLSKKQGFVKLLELLFFLCSSFL